MCFSVAKIFQMIAGFVFSQGACEFYCLVTNLEKMKSMIGILMHFIDFYFHVWDAKEIHS